MIEGRLHWLVGAALLFLMPENPAGQVECRYYNEEQRKQIVPSNHRSTSDASKAAQPLACGQGITVKAGWLGEKGWFERMFLLSEKSTLRAHFREVRRALSHAERHRVDAAIAKRVAALPAFADAALLCTYLSFGAEVDTRALIERAWAAGKVVALPRVVPGARAMRWFTVDSLEGLERSPFGVEEPPADAAREVFPAVLPRAVALVPGLAFDAAGFRLGYGGGFYDTFLADFSGATVGLCRTCQLSAAPLPRGPYDRPVGLVVTEDGDIIL